MSSVGTTVVTIKNDREGEKPAVIAKVRNQKAAEQSISDAAKPLVTMDNGDRLKSWEGDGSQLKIAFVGGNVISGEQNAVDDCLIEGDRKLNPINQKLLASRNAAIITIGTDRESGPNIVDMLSEKKSDDAKAELTYFTETRFTKTGIERRTVSDFGLIGSIIAQLAQD